MKAVAPTTFARMSESLMSRKPLHKRLSRGFATRPSLPPIVEKNWRQKLPGGSPQGCEMPGGSRRDGAFEGPASQRRIAGVAGPATVGTGPGPDEDVAPGSEGGPRELHGRMAAEERSSFGWTACESSVGEGPSGADHPASCLRPVGWREQRSVLAGLGVKQPVRRHAVKGRRTKPTLDGGPAPATITGNRR